jgi:hypothetical protein
MQVGTVRVAGRYQAVPVLLIMSAVFVQADYFARDAATTTTFRPSTWNTRTPPTVARRATVTVAVFAALLLPSWVADFRGPNQRSAGPPWATEVAKATAVCRRGGTASVMLSIDPPRWTITLPCRALVPLRRS